MISIAAVDNGRFQLPVFPDCGTSASLDTVIPVPSILSGYPPQGAFLQILIELIKHDIRQQRRNDTTLRHAFTGCLKETDINMSRLDAFPSQNYEACIADPAAYGFHQQAVMYGDEVTDRSPSITLRPRVPRNR